MKMIKRASKRLREQARDKYRSLSEEENNKKREYGKKCVWRKKKSEKLSRDEKV